MSGFQVRRKKRKSVAELNMDAQDTQDNSVGVSTWQNTLRLRPVNVGGTGKLPMTELKAICIAAGFRRVETYIASGNVVFESNSSPKKVKSELEARLHACTGISIGVVVRTSSEMEAVLKGNPFQKAAPNHTVAIFLDEPPPADALAHAVGHKDEESAPRKM